MCCRGHSSVCLRQIKPTDNGVQDLRVTGVLAKLAEVPTSEGSIPVVAVYLPLTQCFYRNLWEHLLRLVVCLVVSMMVDFGGQHRFQISRLYRYVLTLAVKLNLID